MVRNRFFLISSALVFLIACQSAPRAEDNASETAAGTASEQEIAASLEKLVFVPHDKGAPEVTEAGGVRAVAVLPKVELLAPERMARTLSPTPTLYWHVSKAPAGPVRFTLIADDPSAIDPLIEADIDGVEGEGIYGVSLEDHGIDLEDGKRYIWSITLSAGNQSHRSDLVAQTLLERHDAPDLAAGLNGTRPEERALRLASAGYWYDAVDTLSEQIEQASGSPWQAARARLLDQAGLLQAARYDRQQVGD